MTLGTIIGIGKIRRDTKIYRIFPQNRFFQLFQENRNTLVHPSKWDDPFENVFLKATVVTATGAKGRFSFHNDVYGQCWTLETASDAMWQIYSRDKSAVRVRTTVAKLIDSLAVTHGEWARQSCFIGRVAYLSESELRDFGRSVFQNGLNTAAIARSLLVKRQAYKHENEVRLIYFEPKDIRHKNGIYKYSCDPRSFIDQVMVDGRVSYEDFLSLKKKIMAYTGFSNRQVRRSLLYRPPKDFVVHVP